MYTLGISAVISGFVKKEFMTGEQQGLHTGCGSSALREAPAEALPCPHRPYGAAGREGGRNKAESVTASNFLSGSHICGAKERGLGEDKNTSAVNLALLEMHFNICALTGPRPWAELSLAVKSTNPVPRPIFLPAVFKHCFQTVHQSHKGVTSDASLLKETSTVHGAKQGGNSTMPSPLKPYRH